MPQQQPGCPVAGQVFKDLYTTKDSNKAPVSSEGPYKWSFCEITVSAAALPKATEVSKTGNTLESPL